MERDKKRSNEGGKGTKSKGKCGKERVKEGEISVLKKDVMRARESSCESLSLCEYDTLHSAVRYSKKQKVIHIN